ncbi:hypothetical protein SDC9_173251 [bioreactor metagenome]|uniref:Uncharacterized protein n=1 Tax=bioreactor metagenome TaxID=1076179 RepID=A0A645GGM7_9ZZZZ
MGFIENKYGRTAQKVAHAVIQFVAQITVTVINRPLHDKIDELAFTFGFPQDIFLNQRFKNIVIHRFGVDHSIHKDDRELQIFVFVDPDMVKNNILAIVEQLLQHFCSDFLIAC